MFLTRKAVLNEYALAGQQIEVGDFGLPTVGAEARKLSLLGLLLFALSLLLAPTAQHLQAAYAAATSAVDTPIVQVATAPASTAVATAPTPAPTPPATTPAAAPVAAVPACSKGSMTYPAALNLSALGSGPHASFSGTTTYVVHGLSTSQINSQMAACSPVVQNGDGFDASTLYNLSTLYNFGMNSEGLCTVTSASVGMNVGMVMPSWSNAGAGSSLTSNWNRFITNLQTHENGHAAIDESYASKIYTDMMSVAPTDCGSINATVKAIVANDTAAMDAANNNYDASTNHGATQGASL